MPERIRQKWRPPLALVIGGTLAVVLCLPLLGVGYFRLAGNILGWGETAWLIAWMAIVATVILGFLLWRLVLRPVYALTAHANAVKEGRRDAPLPPHFGTPEITDLARAVQEMAATLQDRETGLRAYTDHVTHELKSPLTSLIGAAELLDGADKADRAQLISTIRTSAQTMQGQLEALRQLAVAREPLGIGPSRLSEVVPGVRADLTIEVNGDPALPMDARALEVVLGHLAQNAAAHGADRLVISAAEGGVLVSDNGPGIAPGNRDRIFDPFFTTRRGAGGTGMGLAIARTMLQAAGGKISLIASDTGAVFKIDF
ncbi:Sensor protein RstB [Roseovarius litorisediminis]|uniref:histidine kinase n=1 Tax=Roseovarius litorisediminis TaxID=1312363 RepID=A0A1Y5RQ04_9RHOB|nr:HAMP domain-containing sensor histidine kinase [Roseovarius litorisediminis]SLN19922.1 Sensor protein RstB [Roseovarius litorisediminis]